MLLIFDGLLKVLLITSTKCGKTALLQHNFHSLKILDYMKKDDQNINISKSPARAIAHVGLFVALICVCSFLSIPFPVPFTMQTFGIFLALKMLGGKKATVAVSVYVSLGFLGLPVFSGFQGGISVLQGPTGGYIFGFILSSLFYWLTEKLSKKSLSISVLILCTCMVIYLTSGALWYCFVYANGLNENGFFIVVCTCILPYIVPDLVKIALAVFVSEKLKKHLG